MQAEGSLRKSIDDGRELLEENDLRVTTIEEVQASQFRILQAIERATFSLRKRVDRTEEALSSRR